MFTAGFTKGMKNPICFVAGTMILTAMGLKAIETIQVGDQVIATNPDTFQTEEKTVVETYINKTTCIVKIIIQNEVICTTMNHPFYVKGQGFLAAGKLSMGDEIMNASGGSYPVECVELEEKQETVYNFQVEDYHTYYVGENSVLVHNDCPDGSGSVDIELKYKEGWTDAQKVEADAKVKALSLAKTVKTPAKRSGTAASSRYKSVYGRTSVQKGYDVDHTIDLQLGGADDILNMNPLDMSVNRSLGVQIKNIIKDYDIGTEFGDFTIQ